MEAWWFQDPAKPLFRAECHVRVFDDMTSNLSSKAMQPNATCHLAVAPVCTEVRPFKDEIPSIPHDP